MKSNTLTGRHAIVTGGSRGIGRAIAAALLRQEVNVSILARQEKSLSDTVNDLTAGIQGSASCVGFAADVSSLPSIELAFKQAREKFGKIELLINNAGIGASAPFAKMTSETWDSVIATNLTGVYNCSRTCIDEMIHSKFGRIVNIASTAGVTGYQYVSAYCAAKHGVVGLTRSLALEVARHNITVNAICPGFTETDILWQTIKTASSKTGRSEAEIREELLRTNPSGRFVTPEEVASSVVWLCRDEQRSITGETVVISGGEVLR